MISTPQDVRAGFSPFLLSLLILFQLISAACVTSAPVHRVFADDARGTVSLQALSSQAIQTSHPITLNSALIARVLRGLRVQERQRILQEMLGGSPAATPVFSEDHIQFLAPQIVRALATATERETVVFTVTSSHPLPGQPNRSITETTAGSLYAYGLSLHVTLSQYRYSPDQPNTDSASHRRLPDTSGLSNRTIQFIPEAAQRPDDFYQTTTEAPTDRMVAIDYQRLQHEPEAETVTERPLTKTKEGIAPAHQPTLSSGDSNAPAQANRVLATQEEEIRTLKDLVVQKDLELELLRKKLQSAQQQLDRQRPTQPPPKRKPASPSQRQPSAP